MLNYLDLKISEIFDNHTVLQTEPCVTVKYFMTTLKTNCITSSCTHYHFTSFKTIDLHFLRKCEKYKMITTTMLRWIPKYISWELSIYLYARE